MEEFYNFRQNKRKNYPLILLFLLMIIILIVVASFYFLSNSNLINTDNNEVEVISSLSENEFAKISQIVVLPTSEAPQLEIVNKDNIESIKLRFQTDNIILGDEVLVYSNSNVVVIYRPIENRVVWVLPL